MEEFHFHVGQIEEALLFIAAYHYSRRIPTGIKLVCSAHKSGGLFGDLGPMCAALVYSSCKARWHLPVWELSRMVRDETNILLTRLISFSMKAAKRRDADLLISYADPTQNHHGGIYRAASWNYHGRRSRTIDGCLIGGKFFHGQACTRKWGTRSPKKLSSLLGVPVLPHYDEGKMLYWKALGPQGRRKAEALHLEKNAYKS